MESASFDYNHPLPPRNGALPSEWAAYRKITGRRLLLPKPVSIGKAVVAPVKTVAPEPAVVPVVEDVPENARRYANRVDCIMSLCAHHFGLIVDDFMSGDRTKPVVLKRHIGMYFAHKLTDRSLPEIGRRFGGKDHTTILYGVRKVKRLLAEGDEYVTTTVKAIEAVLESLPLPESVKLIDVPRSVRVKCLFEEGHTLSEIASDVSMSESSLGRLLTRMGLRRPTRIVRRYSKTDKIVSHGCGESPVSG